MTRQAYGQCDCGKWGYAPAGFNESKHFLKCECGKPMYLVYGNPKDVALNDRDKIENVGLMKAPKH